MSTPAETNVPRPSFRNSEMVSNIGRSSEDVTTRPSILISTGIPMTQTEMKITAMEPGEGAPIERQRDYKGRYRVWPGVLLFLSFVGAGVAIITLMAIKAKTHANERSTAFEDATQIGRKIRDNGTTTNAKGDIISDDGQVGNPKKYPDMGCELPNYLSKDGQIWAQAKNGTTVPVGIKGVNWFGMEGGLYIPFGLWENEANGTSVYEIASFLARNKFNSVRLPVCIASILADKPPQKGLVNTNTNRAMNLTSYISTLKSVVEALAYRQITVLISLHTLSTKASGGSWYSADLGVSEDDFLTAVDKLTSNLCTDKYWNIIGLDLKNEPHECTWGGGSPDWQKGATLIGNRMLKGCENWLAFVEGVNSAHPITLNGETRTYFDWWGGGLQRARDFPVTLATGNKVVWAPHYYNTGVDPSWYLYASGLKQGDRSFMNYVELDDTTLKKNIRATMDDMFGYLMKDKKEALVLGEFAGLYANDKHPKKTTKRTTDFTIEIALEDEYAGAYMWSLNPESAYQFNPADTYGHFTEGLLQDDWLTPDRTFLEGMAPLDKIKDLKMFPCFPKEVKS